MTLILHGEEVLARIARAAHDGVEDAAELLLDKSRRIVPTDTETLSASGRTSTEGLTAVVSYDTPYAVLQHESGYPTHQPPTTKKYLERPMVHDADDLLRAVAAAIRRELGL